MKPIMVMERSEFGEIVLCRDSEKGKEFVHSKKIIIVHKFEFWGYRSWCGYLVQRITGKGKSNGAFDREE